MNALRTGLLASVALLAAGAAQAQTNTTNTSGAATQLNTGGASLPALTYRQLFNCYGLPTDGSTTLPPGCTARVRTDVSLNQASVGSGGGIRGFYTNQRNQFASSQPVGAVHMGHSDAALTQTQINFYSTGGTGSPLASGHTMVAAGQTPVGATQWANGNASYGPLIQLPAMGTPVTIAYDEIYKQIRNRNTGNVVSYRFNVQNKTANGGLRLDAEAYCKIFSGEITNWNDPKLTALNNGVLLRAANDPVPAATWSVPIKVVFRDDTSGTTSLFTRHLRAKCAQFQTAAVLNSSATGSLSGGFNQTFPGGTNNVLTTAGQCASATNNLFATGTWMRGRGSEGVANCVAGNGTDIVSDPTRLVSETVTNGAIGYLSPDFTLPAVTTTDTSTAGTYRNLRLLTAAVQNEAGNFVLPSTSAVGLSLNAVVAPTGAARSNPFNWVADPSGAVAGNVQAIVPATITGGYPIVGTTNILAYTCYANDTVRRAVAGVNTVGATQSYLNWFYSGNANVGAIARNGGFNLMPTAVRSAINSAFLTGTTSTLRIRTAPAAGVCTTGA